MPNPGLFFIRRFAVGSEAPDAIRFNRRDVAIPNSGFAMTAVEAPESWSDAAVTIVASKYFYGKEEIRNADGRRLPPTEGGREFSVLHPITRIVDAVVAAGESRGYFDSATSQAAFHDDLTALLLGQYAAFNSPVWFNVGLYPSYGVTGDSAGFYWDETEGRPQPIPPGMAYAHSQASACFIVGIQDTMESILDTAKVEGTLFKYGSGIGEALSSLRSARERIAGGGRPSGPLSFLQVYDGIARVVKSGGKTRRAARLNNLADWHPDVLEFVTAKAIEERKIDVLIAGGFSAGMDGEAATTAAYQSTNLSLWASDAFMAAAAAGQSWQTTAVTTGGPRNAQGEPMPAYKASDLLDAAATACGACGDPGLQFADTIAAWNPVAHSAAIRTSNPCGEYLFIDDSACNLASLNLARFLTADGRFDVERFRAAVRVMVVAQDVLVSLAGYPTASICRNSHRFRPLGLGPANVGGLLMSVGLPYDSDRGRWLAAFVQATMHEEATHTSTELAEALGPFAALDDARLDPDATPATTTNWEPLLRVVARHRDAALSVLESSIAVPAIADEDRERLAHQWQDTYARAQSHGLRNAQLTLAAPTGTIAFAMGCDTTGIEPEIALVRYKKLAGGGTLKMSNQLVGRALRALGYADAAIAAIEAHVVEHGTVDAAPGLKPEHLPVFDCALSPQAGGRTLSWQAHVDMVAALQPHVSGGLSKTINVPAEFTATEIRRAFEYAHQRGCKSITIYRDRSKKAQPVVTGDPDAAPADANKVEPTPSPRGDGPTRRKLPAERDSRTHHFEVGRHEGYLTVGLYDDGRPAELFITMAKQGSTVSGLMDTIGILVSFLLQHGVSLATICHKLVGSRFEPSGMTRTADIPLTSSIVDYVFRWLGCRYVPGGHARWGVARGTGSDASAKSEPAYDFAPTVASSAPVCECGALMTPSGRCFTCRQCGTSSGGCG